MFAFVNKLKDKPDDVKNRIAIFTAISVTVLIVGVWFLVIKNKSTSDSVNKESISDELKPLMMIFGKAEDGLGEIKEDIKKNQDDK